MLCTQRCRNAAAAVDFFQIHLLFLLSRILLRIAVLTHTIGEKSKHLTKFCNFS